ncbi:hypothetical protein [Methanothrix soehngenii]|jgi:hypothetical protein|uniref:hypothetical protein n=1 Tax=Methanothrix soehngenii TaxID=2223 RepID=UPI003140E566
MTKVLQEFTGQKLWICFLLASTLAAPAAGISVSCSSAAAGVQAVSTESFALDGSTSLHESLALGSGNIVIDRQAEGGGNNSLKQSLKGSDYVLQNNIESQGEFSASTASAATGQSAAIHQNSAGTGSMILEQRASNGIKDVGQEASVSGGTLRSAQSLSAGGQLSASQSTEIAGEEGRVLSGALGEENVLLAEVGFSGMGTLSARLTSRADETAHSEGYAAIDDTVLLNDGSFEAVSREGGSRIMGMAGTRLTEGAGKSIGSFELQVMNLDREADIQDRAEQAGTAAALSSGGSYSSYALTGYRWNQRNPQLQLYLNPTDTPSGLGTEATRNAIAQAANTWDDAVSENLFADGSTVIVDYTKVVDNPFPLQGQEVADGYSVSGWKSLGDSYLGMQRWWSNGQLLNGYRSIVETDSWYNRDFAWTTDLATAQSTGRIDLQSVALHELGHGIGMGDLYTLPEGDPRQSDLQQVMNLYDGPQRELGNGDRAGAQILYNEPMNTNKIALQTNNGQYVCAENGGGSNLVANRDWVLAWETFRRIDLGNNAVALQAANGQYVCAENGGGSNLVANRDWILAWETFRRIDLGNNKVALQAANGQYVCAENGGGSNLVANRDWILAWETFGIEELQ